MTEVLNGLRKKGWSRERKHFLKAPGLPNSNSSHSSLFRVFSDMAGQNPAVSHGLLSCSGLQSGTIIHVSGPSHHHLLEGYDVLEAEVKEFRELLVSEAVLGKPHELSCRSRETRRH